MAAQDVPAYVKAAVFCPSRRSDPGEEPPATGVRSTQTCQWSELALSGVVPLADRPEVTQASLLAACLDNLMRDLLTGCRQHAERALLLLERAQAQEGMDASFQDLCRCMGERLLERKHEPVVRRFETARTDVEVHRLWRECIVRGEAASAGGRRSRTRRHRPSRGTQSMPICTCFRTRWVASQAAELRRLSGLTRNQAVTLQRQVTEAQRLDAARRLCRRPGAVSDGSHRPA
jgi:hypothetical protein